MSDSVFEIVTQAIGYVGLVFSVIAFQCKKHKNVMLAKTANEMFFALQYFLLGAYTGVAMNLIGSLRNLIFAKQVERGRSTLPMRAVFSLAFVAFGLLTWQNPMSLAVILAKVVSTVAYGMKNTRAIRFLTLPTSTCWLIYNYLSSSSAGVLCEAFTLLSIITAIIRIELIEPRLKKRAENGNENS